jgi:threonine dehydrogenase-like Zn-dependent dehydrogenase
MAAAVYTGRDAMEVQDIPVPAVGPGDALIEVSHCGICGTDLHLVLEGYARPGTVLGHEWSGTLVNLSGVTPGDRVLVTGAGPVGLLTTAVLRARGVEDITVSEPAASRRERAVAVGAARVIAPDELGRAPMGRPVDGAFTFAFECSGHAAAAEAALAQLDYAGTLVFVGTGAEQPRVDHNRMIVLELTAIGAYNYDAGGFAPALELLASGRLPLDLLIEPRDVGLVEVLDAIRGLAHGDPPGKVLVRPS